jgi:hypothetical protein
VDKQKKGKKELEFKKLLERGYSKSVAEEIKRWYDSK